MTYQELEFHCGNCPNQFKCMGAFDYVTWGKGVIKTDFECEYQTELTAYLTELINDEFFRIIEECSPTLLEELIKENNNGKNI